MVNAIASQVSTTNARIYAYIAQGIKKHSQFTPAQQVIAKHLGLTIDQTQKGLYWLRDKGIVSIHYRGWKEFNGYSINTPYTSYSFRKVIFDRIRFFHRLALPAWALLAPTQISSPTGGVLLNIKGNVLIKTTQQHERVTLTGVRAREGVVVEHVNMKEEVMSIDPIPQSIKNITQLLNLTKWGQMALTAYSDEALSFAEQQLKKAGRVLNNPFGYFLSQCKKYCEANGVEIQWRKAKFLQESFNMPLGALLVLEVSQEIAKEKKSPQMGGSGEYQQRYAANKARIDAAFKEVHDRELLRMDATRNWRMRILHDVPDDVAKARDIEWCKSQGIEWRELWFY